MRAEDMLEVAAASGWDPFEALQGSIARSVCAFALELGGELAGIFGVSHGPVLAGYDVVWMLTGRAVDRHRRAFWRESVRVMRILLERWPVLANAIDARHASSLRWAQRLGAEIQPARPWGVAGLPFHAVIWRRSECAA